MMSRETLVNRSKLAPACVLLALAGLLMPVSVGAQTPAQAPAPGGGGLRVQQGQPVPAPGATQTPAAAPTPGIVRIPPTRINSGVRSGFPEPVRPGRGRMHLPQTPPQVLPTQVAPPPFFAVPAPRERRRHVVIMHQPYLYSHQPYVEPYLPAHSGLAPAAEVRPVEAEPLTGRDLGDAYLHWDQPDDAIAVYQEHLAENPGDSHAIRMLSLALIDTGRVQEGIAALALAYERDPQLAQSPLPQDVFGPAQDMRRNLNRVSMYANRVNTASAWLSLAVLMQAEGRTRHAARMIDRAEEVGLSDEVLENMRAAVGRAAGGRVAVGTRR